MENRADAAQRYTRPMNSPSQETEFTTNCCPSCKTDIRVEPSILFGEMACPKCSKRLWYLVAADSARLFDFESSTDLQKRAITFIAQRMEVDADELSADPSILNNLETDSLEALELLMDLEEEIGLV